MKKYRCSSCGHESSSAKPFCPECRTMYTNFREMKMRERIARYTGIFPILGIFLGALAAPALGLDKPIVALAGILLLPMIGYPITRFAFMKISKEKKYRSECH
ncbi:MAG: hypothetical protein KKE17_09560 [Proteobacteria bacterium]|nr:hypothetical protein [Pseudomonadota bacterium]MBU1710237.1 hypothetical protein [Pseudomonadota bacterium]